MSNDDAKLEAEALGIRYSVLPIEAAFETFSATLAPIFAGRAPDLTEENIQSRSRGVLLMALSNKFGHVVLTTGNQSEMAVGYSTLDRKSVVSGTSVSVRVDLGGRRRIQKKK